MAELDEILIEHAKHLNKLAKFMREQGDSMTREQAAEVADIIKKNADNLITLAKKV